MVDGEGSRLRGTLISGSEKKEREMPVSGIVLATQLAVNHDQDGPPLARAVQLGGSALRGTLVRSQPGRVGYGLSIADGLGGAGAALRKYGGEYQSAAYIASRKVQECIDKIISNPETYRKDPGALRIEIEAQLAQLYSTLPEQFPPEGSSKVRGTSKLGFPTTLSTAIITPTDTGTRVQLIWCGDSPLTVFTPDQIYSTEVGETGDAPMGLTGCLNEKNLKLHSSVLNLQKDVLVTVVGASDGWYKISGGINKGIQNLYDALTSSSDSTTLQDRLRKVYSESSPELDDTTISIVSTQGQNAQMQLLHPNARPIQLISPDS